MTDARAPEEPYTTSFEATVEHVDDRTVVLDHTYFYAESGGQPADRGVLADSPVVDVQHDGDEVVHHLAEEPSFAEGEPISGAVDPAFRTYCMRAHTASHALYGAGRRLLDDLGYGGFDIGERKVRVDFTTPTDIDDDTLVELERLTNRAVWESRPVSWETYPKAEALELDHVAFNTKTEEGLAGDDVRIVTIGESAAGREAASDPTPAAETDDPWDVAACGGTHVRNTREIGPVTVLERSNPGEGLTRVEFTVGPPGIEQRAVEKRAAMETAARLGSPLENLPNAVERLQADLDEAKAELGDAKADLVEARLTELRKEAVERHGHTWLVGTVDGIGPNDLEDHVKTLAGDAADVIALIGADGRPFVVVGTTGEVDAGDVVAKVTDEFGGGGGGSPQFAQGGGIDAAPDDVVAFLRG